MNSTKTSRGFVVAGLMAAMLFVAASASAHPPDTLVQYHFIYSGAPANNAVADGIITIDPDLLQNPGTNDVEPLGLGEAVVNVTMTVSGATSGNGTFTTADFDNVEINIPTNAMDLNQQWVGQLVGTSVWGTSDGASGDFNFFTSSVNANAPSGRFYFTLVTAGGDGDSMHLLSVIPAATTLFHQGDAVPGIANAFFTAFGVPTINDSNDIAFFAQWKTTHGQTGSGIFTNGVLMLAAGDTVSGPSEHLTIKSMENPVMDNLGNVAFLATLSGGGTSPGSDMGVVSSAPSNTLAVVAQTGKHASGGPTNGVWQSFTSVALPGNGGGALISGQMSVTSQSSKNGPKTTLLVNALWATDSAGDLTIVLQSGGIIGTETVKSFNVLNTVAGSPGQTHAFNGNGQLVAYVTFTDGQSAIVQVTLP